MKKLYFLLFTFLIAAFSFGQVIIAEGFDYADGALVPNGGWANNTGTAGTFLISSGQAVINHANSEDVRRAYTPVSGTVYFAFDFSVDDLGSPYVGTDNEYFAHLDFRTRIDIVPPTSSGDFSIGLSSATATASVIWPNDLTFGQTYRLVALFNQVNGQSQLWINPSTIADASITDTSSPFAIDSVDFRQSTSSENETIRVDNLMVGQTFNDVLVYAPQTTPTITLFDAPASGSTIDLSPEELSGELEFVVTNFNVDTQGNGGDGYIVWTVLNTDTATPHDSGGPLYDLTPDPFTPLEPNYSYYFVAQLISYATSNVVAEYDLNINTLGYNVVANIASVRAGTEDLYYEVSGEVIVSFITGNFRNQIFIQDASGGILIDDPDGIISTAYNNYDGITGFKGMLTSYGNVSEIVPTIDPGAASSTSNIIAPQTVTINDLITNIDTYESELVQINNVTFTAGDGSAMFAAVTNYDISDASGGPMVFRTNYPNDNMTGVTIPNTPTTIVVLAGQFFSTIQVYPLSPSITLSTSKYNQIDGFAMFPNPNSLGYLNIKSKSQTAMKVGVYDILGKQVINKTVSNNRLDVSNLTTGIYIMKISQDDATTTKKLIVK